MENNKRESMSSAISVGKRLRDAREKRSLTIEQVQKQTKIHSTVLIGLEEGRPNETLTDTYIRSFLKKYAQFLGINSVELLKEYFPAHTENAPKPNIPVQENVLPKETQGAPKFLYMAGLTVAAVVSLILFMFIVSMVSTAFKKARPIQKKNSIAPAARKKTDLGSAKVVQKKKPAVKIMSETKELVPKVAPLILEIRVKEAVRVALRKDGVLFFNRVLHAGLVEKTVANNSIELDIAKAGSLSLTLNGKPVDLQSKNAINGLEITRKGVRIK